MKLRWWSKKPVLRWRWAWRHGAGTHEPLKSCESSEGTQHFIDLCGYPLPFMAVIMVEAMEPCQHWIPASLRVARCRWTYHLWGPVSAVARKAIDSLGIDPNLSRMTMEHAEKCQQLCIFGTFPRDVWWILVSPPHWTGVLPANGAPNLGRSQVLGPCP